MIIYLLKKITYISNLVLQLTETTINRNKNPHRRRFKARTHKFFTHDVPKTTGTKLAIFTDYDQKQPNSASHQMSANYSGYSA